MRDASSRGELLRLFRLSFEGEERERKYEHENQEKISTGSRRAGRYNDKSDGGEEKKGETSTRDQTKEEEEKASSKVCEM